MIVHIDNSRPEIQTNEAFISAAYKQYGSRGKKQAEEYVGYFDLMHDDPKMTDDEYPKVCMALRTLFFNMKEDNKKYTPKKYRTEI